jgi:hypothetical protein
LLLLDDGNTVQGILISQTPNEVSIKGNDAIARTGQRSQIEPMEKQNISRMPLRPAQGDDGRRADRRRRTRLDAQ